MVEFINYMVQNKEKIISLLIEHMELTVMSVGLAILIGVPLGILIRYVRKLNKPVLAVANVIQAIPSMALLGFAIPFLGIGTLPAVVMVILYSLLPIIKNTFIGLDNISPQIIEAAKGIGLTKFQILTKIQIPLALPVIMAGVRISAVTAVGLMTIAAFIGAGGLGYLVYSGIRTVNNNQILAGAIPACILALVVDFLVGLVEKLVTPISLQKCENKNVQIMKRKRKIQKIILGAVSGALLIFMCFNMAMGNRKNDKEITIGTMDFTEQSILGHMVGDIIEENTDIKVIRKTNLGASSVCFSALTSKDIDMYVEYTGSAYTDRLGYTPMSNVEEVYNTVKNDFKDKYGLEVLGQLGFNNTYTLATTEDIANKYSLEKLSDLSKVNNKLKAGTTLEFIDREDGLLGLKRKYKFDLKEEIGLDGSPRYVALNSGEVDIVNAFSTDGLLKKFNLKVLEDDKKFFPPYYAIPVVSSEVLEKYPEIEGAIGKLSEVLNNEVMIELNYEVDELQKSPEQVASEFLKREGLRK